MAKKDRFILLFLVASVVSTYAATVSGSIFDAICEKPIVGVRIVMSDSTFRAIVSTETDIVGHYSIGNLRFGKYMLVASALQPEYPISVVHITVAERFVTQDLLFTPIETGTLRGNFRKDGSFEILVSPTGLIFRDFKEKGIISIYSANGKLLHNSEIAANTSSYDLPKNIIAHGVYLVKINLKGLTFCKQIVRS